MPTPEYTRWLDLGRGHFDAARHIDAMLCFRRAIRLEPPALEARYRLGETLWALGLTGDALAVWKELSVAEPRWSRPSRSLAEALLAVGDDPGAIAAAQRAVEADPRDARAALILAVARVCAGSGTPAIDDLVVRIGAEPQLVDRAEVGRAIARSLDHTGTGESSARIAAALAPRARELPVPLLARIAEHVQDRVHLDAIAAAVRDRTVAATEHDALRRLALAFARHDRDVAAVLARRYAELCTKAFAPSVPLPWPVRTSGAALRVAVLATSRADSQWQRVERALALRPDVRVDVTLFVMETLGTTGTAPAGAAVRDVPLPAAMGLEGARLVAAGDPDVLVDLVGLAGATGPLLAARPARAILTMDAVPLSNVAPLVDRCMATTAEGGRELAAFLAAHAVTIRGQPSTSATAIELAAAWAEAVRAQASGAPDAAAARCTWVLEREPEFAPAMAMLGAIAQAKGQSEEAEAWFLRAIAAAPGYTPARAAAAGLALRRGEAGAARSLAIEGLDRGAMEVSLWRQLGHAELARQDGDAAVRAFTRALALEPTDGETHYNQGVALQMTNQLQDAAQAYQRAIAMKPDLIDAEFNLGLIFHKLGQYAAATRALEAVLAREPRRVDAHKAYLQVQMTAGRMDEWFAGFKRFEAACPDAFALVAWALEAYGLLGDFAAVDRYLRRLAHDEFVPANEADLVDALEQLLYVILYFDTDPQLLSRLYRIYNEAATSFYGGPMRLAAARRPGKLRIGYLSGDLRDHVMGKMMLEVIARHDRARFDIHLYSTSPDADGVTERFRELADGFAVVAGLGVTRAAERIAADDLDLLVDLSTHTKGAMPGILACKPARVQITHVASAGAVGLEAIDFKLTDRFVDLPENAQWQIEKPLVMEGCVFPYRHVAPAAGHPFHRAALGIAADTVVIGAFVAPLKLSRRTLALWRTVLEQVPRALLAFSPASPAMRALYPRLLAAAGVAPGRAIFVPQGRDDAERQARYHLVDFVLDTMPYGGVNGVLEPLDMGVPVVTLCGRTHGERTATSILSNLGVTQTIAHSGAEYIGIATRLATEPAFMAEVRGAIAQGLAGSSLVDIEQHTRNLEDAYVRALATVGRNS